MCVFGNIGYVNRKQVVVVGNGYNINSEVIKVCDGDTIFEVPANTIQKTQYMVGDYITYETNMGKQEALFIKVTHPDEWLCDVLRIDTGTIDTAHIDDIIMIKETSVC